VGEKELNPMVQKEHGPKGPPNLVGKAHHQKGGTKTEQKPKKGNDQKTLW